MTESAAWLMVVHSIYLVTRSLLTDKMVKYSNAKTAKHVIS